MVFFIGLLVILFSACNNRPSHVLSEKEMEDVLFDLYIAQVEIEDNYTIFNNDSVRKQNLLNSVFEKHGITGVDLDTSLVWYNAHLDAYFKVNDRVKDRFVALRDTLKARQNIPLVANENSYLRDTTVFLQGKPLQNIYLFNGGNYRGKPKNAYTMQFNALGIRDSILPILTFTIQTKDSIYTEKKPISKNGRFASHFSVADSLVVRKVYGSIYLPVQSRSKVLLTDFTLVKLDSLVIPSDSLVIIPTDSLDVSSDSLSLSIDSIETQNK